jgi:hypothetical protein
MHPHLAGARVHMEDLRALFEPCSVEGCQKDRRLCELALRKAIEPLAGEAAR